MSGSVLHLTDYRVAMEQGYNLINGMGGYRRCRTCGKRNRKHQGIRAEPLVAAAALGVKLTGNIDNEVSVMGPISSPEI